MSILIDELIKQYKFGDGLKEYVNYGWFFAKPYDLQICSISTFFEVMKQRFSDAFRVLTGKSRAYHYMEDEN